MREISVLTHSLMDYLLDMWRLRLARRLFIVVILAIIAIELIIIFPSYTNFKHSSLNDLEQLATSVIKTALTNSTMEGELTEKRLHNILQADSKIKGITLLDQHGAIIANAGETIESRVGSDKPWLLDSDQRYEIHLSRESVGINLDIIVRMDSSQIGPALAQYVVRISGLVLIISLFVGLTVFLYLALNFKYPLKCIRESLEKARGNPAKADEYTIHHDRNDEFGEIIDLLNNALRETANSHRSDIAYQEKRLRDFAAAGSDWFWEMDKDLRFSYFSDQFESVSGVQPNALLGKTREESGTPQVSTAKWQAHLETLKNHQPFRDFIHSRDKSDGERVWLSINGKPIYSDEGEFSGYRGNGSDITVLHEAQQQLVDAKDAAERGNLAKADFLATMSHEIRTPMNGVIGMTELLIDSGLNPEQKQYAKIIRDSGDALLQIINDILDFSKLEAQEIDLEQLEFSLVDVINGVVSILSPQATEKGLMLSFKLETDSQYHYLGDYGRIRQVLMNLVGNAIKFTRQGAVTIICRQIGINDGTPCIRIEIKDTGIGIPAAVIDKLFDSFTQADASTSRHFGGTGLGLAICRKIIDAMGGEIGVSSKEGEGSHFSFDISLPQIEDHDDSSSENTDITLSDELVKTNKAGNALSILVVDDIPVNQLVAEKMLANLGYQVDKANDGNEAIKAVVSHNYDVIFMDIQMPVMDGYEATRQIRKLNDTCSDVPIIAMTANTQDSDRQACLESGMSDFIGKPFVKRELISVLNRHFFTNKPL